jgi:hypothetical protein
MTISQLEDAFEVISSTIASLEDGDQREQAAEHLHKVRTTLYDNITIS